MNFSTQFQFLEEEEDESIFSKKNKNKSHKAKTGLKKKWVKRQFFERDFLAEEYVSNKYAACSKEEINLFFQKIKAELIRPRESEIHARNKICMWLDWLHNTMSWKQVEEHYKISASSAIKYVHQVTTAILKSFQGTNIISFPSEAEKLVMFEILKKQNAKMPHILFTMDGKDALCNGKVHSERLSYKYKFLPTFTVLFVVERVLGTICAVNMDREGKKHDLRVLEECSFYRNLEQHLGDWLVIADTGYKNEPGIAASVKRNDRRREQFSKSFWKDFNRARGLSEVVFAHFFSNKFPLLSHWKCTGKNTFEMWAKNVMCCVILYNCLKRRTLKSGFPAKAIDCKCEAEMKILNV